MTITEKSSTRTDVDSPDNARLLWAHVTGVQPSVWVGRSHGAFIGMIEARWQNEFAATTRLGRHLGNFVSLDEAKKAFVVG